MADLNPQARQMADESMVRTLAAQAEAIWPQELPLLRRVPLPPGARILDAGCGTGEGASRLAEAFPGATVLGVDIVDAHLELARRRFPGLASRLTFEHRSVYQLGLPDGSFDLTVSRHVIHSIPHAEQVLAELIRVTRRGGTLHLIPEDYGMLHFQPKALREFWYRAPEAAAVATGTDMFSGRDAFTLLTRLGLADVTVDYVVVDTVRVPRETFAAILSAWKDGYVEPLAQWTGLPPEEVARAFDAMLANVRDPQGYAAWMVPVVRARVP